MNSGTSRKHYGQRAGLFTEDFLEQPYWWNAAHPNNTPETKIFHGGSSADVVIIGSGLTGIVAAMELARTGTDVIVVDADQIGSGAARRSAGMVGRSSRKSVSELTAQYGAEKAKRIYSELNETMRGVFDLVAREKIDCDLVTKGRFIAANSDAHLGKMVKSYEKVSQTIGITFDVVSQAEQRREVGSDLYKGGVMIPDLGSLHPGKLHEGLLRRAIEAGVRFYEHNPVYAILDRGQKKIVKTSKGDLTAQHVVLATNGYTTRDLKWAARRLIPFRAFMIATEELPQEMLDELIPHDRTYVDSLTNSEYFRRAADTNSLLFGGFTGTPLDSALPLAEKLHGRLAEIFPQLGTTRLSRIWTGRCAATFDLLPHTGQHNGIHYALGYCFSGINLATYFGARIAKRILDQPLPDSVFENTKFGTVPFYNGKPWFIPAVMKYYDFCDNRIARKG